LIFKTGVHKQEVDPVWTVEKVRRVFEQTKKLSPLKIPYTHRHPVNSLPVYGFTDRESLRFFERDGSAYIDAQPTQFADDFIPALKRTGFDKVSIGLGKEDQIIHIGLTDKPAVDGLGLAFESSGGAVREVEFTATDLGVVKAFEVKKWDLQYWIDDVADLFRRFREKLIADGGVEEADKYLPFHIVEGLKNELPNDEVNGENKNFESPDNENIETMTEAEKKEQERLKQENEELRRKNQEYLEAQKKAHEEYVKAEVRGFCEKHANVVTPKVRDEVEAILLDLYGAKARTFERDGKSEEKSSYDAFKELIASAKPAIIFEDVATKRRAGEGAEKTSARGAACAQIREDYENLK